MSYERTELDQKIRTMTIIWLVLLMSQFMFLGVVYSVRPDLFASRPDAPLLVDEPVIVLVFAALALTNLAISFILRAKAVEHAVTTQDPNYVGTGLIIGCAFCETISILGVVLALAFAYQYFYVWFVVGILGILLHYPRRKQFIDAGFNSTPVRH